MAMYSNLSRENKIMRKKEKDARKNWPTKKKEIFFYDQVLIPSPQMTVNQKLGVQMENKTGVPDS